ncbi:hypothetical protein Clacol_007283 [Clathrus columnatus]|uniref:Mediator of RNA polymerase II transcription subunit 8 n=1 Tax=Clathrus columnatus TaxID=1419009 RepID=A0AAV5AEG9_9AGAM|nr:hypothetical protein Clacol_007283 [Clathrus columnatus]
MQHVGQLESLKYRLNQLNESIRSLQFFIHNNGHPSMPPWPDILARYNLLLSQIHALFNALSYIPQQQQQQKQQEGSRLNITKPLQNLVVYPSVLITPHQLDHGLQQLFRTSQTPEVLKEEDGIVRRIGSMLKTSTPEGVPLHQTPEGCLQVVQECTEIKHEHDARVERAVRAVTLLKDRYDWHARVEPQEEQEQEEQDATPEDENMNINTANVDDGDIIMDVPPPPEFESEPQPPTNNEAQNDWNSEASTPPLAQSDAVDAASVTEAVLGESSTGASDAPPG